MLKRKKELENSIIWAEKYIEDFRKNEEFNPYDVLINTENRTQKLFMLCVDYEIALEEILVDFKRKREKIIMEN